MITVEIDKDSGFCFGVVNAISRAEKELAENKELYCLGDIVHNSREVNRLETKGLRTVDHEQMAVMYNKRLMLRAHGEPPKTYQTAYRNKIIIIDATCPVVLKLQRKIRKSFLEIDTENTQIVIFGKTGHAEVNGLVGQTDGKAVVIEGKQDLKILDFNKNIRLFSQTTMSVNDFKEIVSEIQSKITENTTFKYHDTICRQVANRIPNIRLFAKRHDVVLFVAGGKSSNGKVLLDECRKANSNTYLIEGADNIDINWLQGIKTVGICGATSTPKWLMEEVAEKAVLIGNNQ
ncbi:MAG: 4-hydroxy-3-methylbut-2-enyl diphosphate reductase [Dysgonamonadaceae bacterium]|jgi:4-hydroxy-3-methylbut-2-enyl diphosphate reductase|nr:4-hydroxy-3-methylbut-2-enyl diphosphate reductase [Dysgonamonadaceae bacterium]